MKRILLLSALLAARLAAQTVDSATLPQKAVREKLPAYSAEEHTRAVAEEEARLAARAAAKAAADADPDLVVLAPMTVMEKAIQRMNEDSLYRKGAHDKELVKRELSGFDRYFLNRYTLALPLPGGISVGIGNSKTPAERARDAYLERKKRLYKEQLGRLAQAVATEDPREARALRKELRNEPTTGQPITYEWRSGSQR